MRKGVSDAHWTGPNIFSHKDLALFCRCWVRQRYSVGRIIDRPEGAIGDHQNWDYNSCRLWGASQFVVVNGLPNDVESRSQGLRPFLVNLGIAGKQLTTRGSSNLCRAAKKIWPKRTAACFAASAIMRWRLRRRPRFPRLCAIMLILSAPQFLEKSTIKSVIAPSLASIPGFICSVSKERSARRPN